jgi:hypothetical protein
VLPDLTRYLLQYKRLSIPHVGSFELVQYPPEYNVVDKVITPPRYQVRHDQSVSVTGHQIGFLASSNNSDEASVKRDLEILGEKIREIAGNTSFRWNGIGVLSLIAGRMKFENDFPDVPGLKFVSAQKVLRDNVEHLIRVGETETTVAHKPSTPLVSKKYVNRNRIGWIILILVILILGFILYRAHFNPMAAGLQWKVIGRSF